MPSNRRLPLQFVLSAILFGCILSGKPSSAQDPWISFYGGSGIDWVYSVAEVPGAGFVAAGHTQSAGAGDYDAWIFATDPVGNLLWEKVLGGQKVDKLYAVAVTPAGDIYAAGYTESFGAGEYDIWVIKLTAQGQVLWQKTYGGTGFDFLWPGGIAVTDDGGCALAGTTSSFGKGIYDALVLRLNPDGSVRWQKAFGGTNDDRGHAICPSPDGGFVVAGFTASFGAGNVDGWLLKLSKTGILEWQKTFGGSREDWFYSVTPFPGGGYAVAGSTKNGKTAGQWDYFLLRVGEDGEPLWERTVGGLQEDSAISLAVAPDGGLAACGQTMSFGTGSEFDAWVVKFDAAGEMQGQHRFYGNKEDRAYAIIPASEGGFLMAGGTYSYGPLSENGWLFRLDADASPGATCVATAVTAGKSDPASFPAKVSAGVISSPSVTVTATAAQSAPPFSTVDNCCALSCSATASQTAGDAPLLVEFDAIAHASFCPGELAFFWDFGDGGQTSGQSVAHTYAAQGTYNWTLTAAAGGVSCQRTGTVTVAPPCRLACDAAAQVTVGQAPLPVSFTSTLWPRDCQGEASYSWDFGDGYTSGLAAPSHTYAAPGTFTWNMTVLWDGASCSDQGTLLVTEPCTMSCSATGSPSLGEVPLEVLFSDSVSHTHCNDAFAYLWDFGDGQTSSAEKPKHTYTVAGTFAWTLTITSGNTVCSAHGSLTALPTCDLACTATVTPPTGSQPLTVGYEASAIAQNCTQPLAYAWDFGDGSTSSEASGTHTYAEPGTYAWKVGVTSGKGGCQKTGSVELGPTLPGDCDGDGSVSIGEVQKAITMFLGLVASDCGVDCSGDGTISIGEVQKVINAFLGLPSSC